MEHTHFVVHRVVQYLTLYLLCGTQSGSISHTILTLWYTEWFNISHYTYFVVHRVVHYLTLYFVVHKVVQYLTLYLLYGTQSGSLSHTILTLWYTEWFNISYYTYFVVHRVVHYLILYLLCGTQSGSLSHIILCGTRSGSISHTILTLWYTEWFIISHYTYFMVHRVVQYLILYLLCGTQSGSISHIILTLWYTEWFIISYYTYFVVHRVVHYHVLTVIMSPRSLGDKVSISQRRWCLDCNRRVSPGHEYNQY